MSSKKLTEEQALEVLNQKSNPYMINMDENGLRRQANTFIVNMNVKAGSEWVQTKVIYWVYLKYCSFYNLKPIKISPFFHGWKKFFKYEQKHPSRYERTYGYLLNPEPFKMSQEETELMWQHYKEENEKKLRKKQKRLQRELKKQKKIQEQEEKLLQVLIKGNFPV